MLRKPDHYAYDNPDLLAFHDAPTVIEQRLFRMHLEHRMRTFQGAVHNNPDYSLWYGWSEMVQDLTEIRELASGAARAPLAGRRGTSPMTGATLSLSVLAIAALALIGVVVRRPETAVTVGGKVLAFAALFLLPGLVLLGGAKRHYEQAQTTTFCLSCRLMEPWRESLHIDDPRFLPAAHYQNRRIPVDRACYTCHTNYTMFGGVDDKLRGVRHVWHTVWGTVSDPGELY